MGARYRDFGHTTPRQGNQLPAFIVSEYEAGDVLLFSHGGFDTWCVYHAVPMDTKESFELPNTIKSNPFSLDTLKVEKTTGTVTDFTGSFVEYAVVPFDFDAPEDVDYLQDVRSLAEKYGEDRVWNTFLKLYEAIPQQRGVGITREMTNLSAALSEEFAKEDHALFTFDCLLCAMVAENNRLRKYGSKFDTKLGKKVKALGVYQAIYEKNLTIREVANYSKGLSWREISKACRDRGITTPDFA